MSCDAHLVDDLVGALLADQRLDLLGFVGAHEVLGEDALHRLQALRDDLLVLGRAVVAEQVLQHEDRDVRALLHQLREVLANDLSREVLVQQRVQVADAPVPGLSEVIVKAPVDNHRHRLHLGVASRRRAAPSRYGLVLS